MENTDLFSAIYGHQPKDKLCLSRPSGVNQVWEYKDGRDSFVLRFSNLAESAEIFRKEAWCIQAAAKAGVPGAEVMSMGQIDDTAWMIQTKIDGIGGPEWQGDQIALWREVGRLAERINSIAVEGYGHRLAPGKDGVFWKTWPQMLDTRLSWLFDDDAMIRSGTLNPQQNKIAHEKLKELYNFESTPKLAHNDLFLKNIIVGNDGKVHILDWGDAGGCPAPYSEFMHIAAWGEAPDNIAAFREGYGISESRFENMKEDISKLVLLRVLTASYLGFKDTLPHRHGVYDRAQEKFQQLFGERLNPYSYLTAFRNTKDKASPAIAATSPSI